MVGVNPFDFHESIQGILIDPSNWIFVPATVKDGPCFDEGSFYQINNLMPCGIAALIRIVLQRLDWLAVGQDGFAGKEYNTVGNYRLSNYNEALAELLWKRIKPFLPETRTMTPYTPTDHNNHPTWRPVGVSPLFRYIRYKEGGELVAHYDATYEQDETHRTLMSLVIYLTHNEFGATRFINDPQEGCRMDEMDFSDWNRSAKDHEVILTSYPEIGKAIVFDHRLLHDGEPYRAGQHLCDNEKIIIRTDIMFEKC